MAPSKPAKSNSATAATTTSAHDPAAAAAEKAEKIAHAPLTQIALRDRTTIHFHTLPADTFPPTTSTPRTLSHPHYSHPSSSGFQWNHDGSYVAVITQSGLDILHVSSAPTPSSPTERTKYTVIIQLLRPGIASVQWSPCSTQIAAWSVKGTSKEQPENLIVYDASSLHHTTASNAPSTLPTIHRFTQKIEFTWHQNPPLQWSKDDMLMVHLDKHDVYFYNNAVTELNENGSRRWQQKLHLDRLVTFALTSTTSQQQPAANADAATAIHIATFTPQHTATPAKLSIYLYNNSIATAAPVTSKQFFKAEEAIIRWNRSGTALLCQNATFTDKTGKSYYGESQLHCMSIDGKVNSTVPLPVEGPIQDFAWHSTNSNDFIAVQGFQPAKAVLYSIAQSDVTPTRDYGHSSRNTLRLSTHGRNLLIGGFGNLAGKLEFWDQQKFRKLGEGEEPDGAKYIEWTPDSRMLITAALRPWRTVDNGYKIWSYAGELLYSQHYDELYQVAHRPAPFSTTYPLRPPSPRITAARQEAAKQSNAKPATNGHSAASAPAAAPARSAYVPPHLRGQQGSTPTPPRDLLHGNLTAQAPKKLTGGKANGTSQQATATITSQPSKPQVSEEDQLHARSKQLHKQLRTIADVKSKQDHGDELNDSQRQKLAQEHDLNDELNRITERLKNLF